MSPTDELCIELDELLSKPGGIRLLARNEPMKERLASAYVNAGDDWFALKDVFRKHNKVRDGVAVVIAKSRELQGVVTIGGAPREPGQRIRDVWEDAPVAEDAVMPPQYGLADHQAAIYRKEHKVVDGSAVEKHVPVSYDPIFITRRMLQRENGHHLLQLTWRIGRTWHDAVFDREDIFSSREIVKTAALGSPVGSDNAGEMVQYLRAYENLNRSTIDIAYTTSQMGWIGDDENPTKHGFMCGQRQIGANGKAFELRTIASGEVEQAQQIQARGTFEAWKKAIEVFDRWPVVKLLTYAMLAPPLLPIVDAPNAIIESVNRTSRSKTYAVMMAQSVWKSASAPMRTWDNTINNFESLANLSSGIPLLLDDTMLAIKNLGSRGEELVGKAIYKFVSGVGRGRDTRDGGQRSLARWRTVLISTGETPSSDLAHAEGAAARVLSLWAAPTGPIDPAVGAIVDDLVSVELSRNFGHAGPRVVQWLHDNREQWDMLRGAYDEATLKIRTQFPTPAGIRLARTIALLEVAALVGHCAGCFPWKPLGSLMDDPEIKSVLSEAVEHASRASDRAKQAWQHVISYAQARPDQWVPWGCEPGYGDDDDRNESRQHKRHEPNGGWLGWRRRDQLGWLPSQLRRAFADGNFNTETILRAWSDAGVLVGGTEPSKVDCGGPAGPEGGRRRLYVMKIMDTSWD